jgi:RNA polymerase sigma factor (sigma-70 family)
VEASALQAPAGLNRLSVAGRMLRLRSDEQLVALFRAGSDNAFGVLHDRYQARLLAYARQMLGGSRADAEDVVQDVFMRASGALRASNQPISLRAWLYRVAHNRCIDQIRRPPPPAADGLEVTEALAGDPLAEAERREHLRQLVVDLGRLPEQQRSALLMRELEGLPYADLAEALGTTVPAVKSLLVRARIGLVEAVEARETACTDIRADLAASRGRGVRASALARRHLRDCAGCREYRTRLRGVERGLAALSPGAAGPFAGLAKLLGLGGAGSGAAIGGGAGSGAAIGGGAGSGAAIGGGAVMGGAGGVAAGGGATTKVAALVSAAAITMGGAAEVEHIVDRKRVPASPATSSLVPFTGVAASRSRPEAPMPAKGRSASSTAGLAAATPSTTGARSDDDEGAPVARGLPGDAARQAPAGTTHGTSGSTPPGAIVQQPPSAAPPGQELGFDDRVLGAPIGALLPQLAPAAPPVVAPAPAASVTARSDVPGALVEPPRPIIRAETSAQPVASAAPASGAAPSVSSPVNLRPSAKPETTPPLDAAGREAKAGTSAVAPDAGGNQAQTRAGNPGLRAQGRATGQAEATTSQADTSTAQADTTTEPDSTTAQADTTTEPDSTTAQADTTTEPDSTTAQADTTTAQADSTTAQADSTTAQADSTTAQADSTTEPDSTTAQANSTTTEPDAGTAS